MSGRVYSYLRFSDPRQAAGSSADRQLEYARRWAGERGRVLDEALSMRDEGLSAFHQRHVKSGALGVFLRAVEDGKIEAGSVLIVEGLDRLSRAEPIQAQAQLAQIINAGITVVTASDGKEYNRERLKAQPMDLVYSLLVMIRAHEESDTKSKRVRAAIRRQCEGWLDGTFRGVIRSGRDPQWLEWDGAAWSFVPGRVEAVRFALDRYLAGVGAVEIQREMGARGLYPTENEMASAQWIYKLVRRRALVGEKSLRVDGQDYVLPGYYPALLTESEFARLADLAGPRRPLRRVAEIPGVVTGLGIAFCGYCGKALTGQNIVRNLHKGKLRIPDGHRRLLCGSYNQSGATPCPQPGSMSVAPVEMAVMMLCADPARLTALQSGGDAGEAIRAEVARKRKGVAKLETQLARLTEALLEDDGPVPIAFARKAREIEAQIDAARAAIDGLEREAGLLVARENPNLADEMLALIEGVANQERDARLRARELVRQTIARVVVWHAGDPPNEDGETTIEVTARGGGTVRFNVPRRGGLGV